MRCGPPFASIAKEPRLTARGDRLACGIVGLAGIAPLLQMLGQSDPFEFGALAYRLFPMFTVFSMGPAIGFP